MNKDVMLFAEEIAALWPGLAEMLRSTLDYWAPEVPPTTMIMADLGIRFVEDFKEMDVATRRSVLQHVERSLRAGEEPLSTAVATGFIEALVGEAVERGTWEVIRLEMGELSRAHADMWAES